MKKESAKATKSNFWNDLRVKNNYSYAALGDALSLAPSTIATWFCGKAVPKKKHLKDLCDLFGVDYAVGEAEFAKAKASWTSIRGPKTVAPKKNKVTLVPMVAADPEVSKPMVVETAEAQKPADESPRDGIFRKLYGKLSYDDYEFLKASTADGKNPLEFLYKKVDFDEFIQIMDMVQGV